MEMERIFKKMFIEMIRIMGDMGTLILILKT